ncbi:hypothetical protein D3C85_1276520 [compost metagenome]
MLYPADIRDGDQVGLAQLPGRHRTGADGHAIFDLHLGPELSQGAPHRLGEQQGDRRAGDQPSAEDPGGQCAALGSDGPESYGGPAHVPEGVGPAHQSASAAIDHFV